MPPTEMFLPIDLQSERMNIESYKHKAKETCKKRIDNKRAQGGSVLKVHFAVSISSNL